MKDTTALMIFVLILLVFVLGSTCHYMVDSYGF